MRKLNLFLVVIAVFFMQSTAFAASDSQAAALTPAGFWKTIDDVTGKPKAIVQLWETPDKIVFGRVLKIFPRPGHDQNEVCVACDGDKHNKRVVGMVILENLKQSTDDRASWTGGKILDPKNGKTYQSNIRLVDNGRKLDVKGYIGTPLFGRTQTWVRVADLEKA